MANKFSFDKLLVVDLEATCWETREESNRNTSEIIEIGLALINLRTEQIEKNEGFIVKPTISKVSEFCTKLTTITQEQVDKGLSFERACAKIITNYKSREIPWASFGNYDYKMVDRQCRREGVLNPFSDQHINVKLLASLLDKPNFRRSGMDGVLTNLGIELEGTHHRGVDDAKNIAKIWLKLTGTQ